MLLPLAVLGKDGDSILPSWFGTALADPDTYVGVAPPCDNATAAEDMAIATALLHYMFVTGGYEARIEGALRESESGSPLLYSAMTEGASLTAKADVILTESYVNSRKECFVACRVVPGVSSLDIKFMQSITIDDLKETCQQSSAFDIKANVRRLGGRSLRAGLAMITGNYDDVYYSGNRSQSLVCDGVMFFPAKVLSYGNAGNAAAGTARYTVRDNLGTALFNLYTAFPANIPDLWKKVSILMGPDGDSNGFGSDINLRFSQKSIARPMDMRLTGLNNGEIVFSLDQSSVKEKFEKEYAKADGAEKYFMAFSSDSRGKYGFTADVTKAYLEAVCQWTGSSALVKGHIVHADDANPSEGLMSATESSVSAGYNFNVIYHIGDGKTMLPQGVAASGFDYSRGVTLLNLEDKEERLAALKKSLEADLASSPNGNATGSAIETAPQKPVFVDVDHNIPVTGRKAAKTFAVVVANENYENADNVPTAGNDGKVFCEYLRKVMGVPAENIYYFKNATYGKMLQGLDRIKKAITVFGDVDIIYYYAGHGVPDNSTGATYLLPVDANPGSTAACLSVDELYRTFASSGARTATVFLDACFSGSARGADKMLVAARGVRIKPKVNRPSGKLVVFSACSGDETAHSVDEAHHGVFTYHLLEKLRESNGAVTLGELSDHLTEAVPRTVFRTLDKVQTPTVATGIEVADTWRSLPLVNDR